MSEETPQQNEEQISIGRASTTPEQIAIMVQANLPVLGWGEPGTGKTAFVKSLAIALNQHFEILIASIREPSDFGGLPVIRPEGLVLHTPAWALRLLEKGGMLIIDEATTCPPSVQAALLRVIHERVVGDTPLPADKVRVLALANPPDQAAGGWSLSPPMANRFVHLNWQVSHRDWCTGMMEDWPTPKIPVLPDTWRTGIPHARSLVTSYIAKSPTSLQAFPKEAAAQGLAWPSCRTWDYASTAIAAALSLDINPLPFTAGCVGPTTARTFQIWLKNLDLPDPEEILAAPEKFVLPDRQDKLFAILTSVTAAFSVDPTHSRWTALWKVYAAVSKSGKPDMVIVPVRSVLKYYTEEKYPTPPEAAHLLPLLQEAGLIKRVA